MSRRGLFEFATKELSQDALLGWLFSNYEDEKVGTCSKELLSTLTKLNEEGHDFVNPEDIVRVEVKLQCSHMDIVIDFWTKDGKQRLMVIEDKAFTNEHNQLEIYDKTINSWNKKFNNERPTYKIFYKTGEIDQEESERVEKSKWFIFDLPKIVNFLKSFKDTNDEILKDYINYIFSLSDDRTQLSNKQPIEWNFDNWKYFFENNIKPQHKELVFYYQIYLGRYLSLMAYFRDLENVKHSTVLELIFRKNNNISALVHPYNTQCGKDSWKRDKNKEICELIHNYFSNNENPTFKRFEKAQTVATSKFNIEKTSIKEIENQLSKLINDFKKTFKQFNV